MSLISYYNTGTASVAANGTAVTGQGTSWLGSVKPGDLFTAAGLSERILSVDSNTSLTLARGWPGSARTAAAYEIRVTPPAAEMTASVRELLEKLRQGLWLTPNATGTLAERAAFDSARRGFIYMQTDVSPFLVYVKTTDANGAWSDGYAPQQGPAGPYTTIQIGDTSTLDPGADATVEPVQVGDVVTLNFGIPAGTIIQAGSTTTLAPDQPASVDFEPIPGGFELNFNIPRGPTGDIDGVTSFWVTRLGADATATAARAGLGAMGIGQFGWGANNANVALPDNNADTLNVNGVYRVVTGSIGTPNQLGQLLHMGQGSNVAFQIFIGTANTIMSRYRNTSSVWSSWRVYGSDIDLMALPVVA